MKKKLLMLFLLGLFTISLSMGVLGQAITKQSGQSKLQCPSSVEGTAGDSISFSASLQNVGDFGGTISIGSADCPGFTVEGNNMFSLEPKASTNVAMGITTNSAIESSCTIKATDVNSPSTFDTCNLDYKFNTRMLTEICGNDLDDNNDGVIDEGCYKPTQRNEGSILAIGIVIGVFIAFLIVYIIYSLVKKHKK